MPGYGSGPFGGEPFGEFNWARRVLYELAPSLHRDADVDRLFELYAEAQGEVFTDLRRQIRDFFELREPRSVRTQFDETGLLLLGAIQLIKEPVEQTGIRGSVSGVGVFQTERGRFTFADVGKELTVSGSTLTADNNTSVVITSVVDSTSILTNPPLVNDAGPLRWEVRPVSAALANETIVEVVAGDVEPIGPGWILTDGLTEFEVIARKQFFDISSERKLQTEREGQDGSINASLRFISPTADFQRRDVGKRITITGSTALKPTVDSSNEGKFSIVELISPTEVVLDSPFLFEETGPLTWAILRRPQLTLSGTSTLRGVVEQSGEDMTATATGFTALSGEFSPADVGKLLTVYGESDPNNGVIFEVTGAPLQSVLETDPVPTLTVDPYRYELRTATTTGDTREVAVRAPSLIRWLAQDFGIEIDVREEEEFQRRWVESVSNWIGDKGVEETYRYLAALTGYSPTTVESLYRVSQELYLAVLAAGGVAYAVEEGQSGSDGSLSVVGSRVRFSSPTAAFTAADVGRVIETTGTSGSANDGFRTIDSIVDANTAEFRPVDGMTGTADPNNGSITWRVVRLYSQQAPFIPVYDEINADRMEYLKTSAVFQVDKYCWEQLPSPWSTLIGPGVFPGDDGVIEINSVEPGAASAFPITYTLRGQGDFDVITGLGVGKWKLTNFGTEYFLETVPKIPRIRSGAVIDPTGANVPIGSELENVDAFGLDTSAVPFFVKAADGAGVFDNVRPGDIFVVRGPSDRSPPAAFPARVRDGWRIGTVAPDGSAFELDPSYTLASTGLPSGFVECYGDVIEVFNDGTAHSGVDASLTNVGPSRVTIGSVGFDAFADDGKRILIYQSPTSANRGTYILDTFVGAFDFDLDPTDTPVTPDADNGALTWALVEFEFQVIATTPPSIGISTIEYICAEVASCDYCKSNRIRIETTTPFVLEGGVERLRDRIGQATPKHVEVLEAYGVSPLATLSFTASGSSTFPP